MWLFVFCAVHAFEPLLNFQRRSSKCREFKAAPFRDAILFKVIAIRAGRRRVRWHSLGHVPQSSVLERDAGLLWGVVDEGV